MHTRVGIPGTEAPKPDWTRELGTRLVDVELFARAEAAVAARRAADATRRLPDGTVGPMMAADDAFMDYRKLVQRDLEFDETELPSWRDTAPPS
ncbi:hypothetical protein Pure05_42350 [Paenarthrobacter ureafaciens]|nr:hypothetical protein AUT26_16640 [Arthrobacter sp. ATCC 21022]GLU61724.1 hypothetical protein Pure01_42370 [Paenarthrobacter ureafaciens]KUR64490.1 hypothetical protein JM67_10695 [Arthrobacter sp. ATCC 21022]GLU65998.1 hypothetical protein Pure02_42480 [Paenarthrobacter ureafaciens]GLU69630.1 hypothetical protein Pure03_36060 [Paenarthrobacter ureafaciens]